MKLPVVCAILGVWASVDVFAQDNRDDLTMYSCQCHYILAERAKKVIEEFIPEIHFVSGDESTNMLHIGGRAKQIAKIKNLLRSIDVPPFQGAPKFPGKKPPADRPAEMSFECCASSALIDDNARSDSPKQPQKPIPPIQKTYPVAKGHAEETVKMLRAFHRTKGSEKIVAISADEIQVLGPLEFHVAIATTLDTGTRKHFEQIRLSNLDAEMSVNALKSMLGKSGPAMDWDPKRNAIFLAGTPEEIKDAKDALHALTKGSGENKSPKNDEPAIEKPLPARRFQFAIDGKPWPQVLQWLSETSGLPVIQKSTPAGKFTFIAPKGKTYTLAEIVDFLNESLLTSKYHLIQGEKAYHLISSDERFERAMIPRVTFDELAKRGKYEMVCIVVGLHHVNSDEVAPQIKKILGSSGEVLTVSNQLVIFDLAGNLREVLKLIAAEENREAHYSFVSRVCEYVPAERAKKNLEELFAAGVKKGALIINFDEGSNTVHITGRPGYVLEAKNLLPKIDSPSFGPRFRSSPPILKAYSVPDGNAEVLAKMLKELVNATDVKIMATSPRQIAVFGRLDVQVQVAHHIEALGLWVSTEAIPLKTLDAVKTAATLKSMLGPQAPFILGNGDRNVLIVRGTKEQIDEVKKALPVLGETPGTRRVIKVDTGNAELLAEALKEILEKRGTRVEMIVPGKDPKPGPTKVPQKKESGKGPADTKTTVTIMAAAGRLIITCDDPETLALIQEVTRIGPRSVTDEFTIISLRYANAAEVAKTLDACFNGSVANGDKAKGSNGKPRPERIRVVADPATNSLLIRASALDLLSIRNAIIAKLDVADSSETQQSAVQILGPFTYVRADDVARVLAATFRDEKIPITAEPKSNTVVIRGTDAQQREFITLARALEEKAKESDQKAMTNRTYDVVYLKHAKAVETAKLLDELLNGEPTGRAAKGKETAKSAKELLSGTRIPMAKRVHIIADVRTNSVGYYAPNIDPVVVLKLIQLLDVPALATAENTTVFKLKHAVAADLVKTLTHLYRAEKSLALATDTRTNSIVVRAPAALTTELEAVIVRLDYKD